MHFTERWQQMNKRGARAWATTDNDKHGDTGYIYEIDIGFSVSVSMLSNGYRMSMATEYFGIPKTLDEAKELAEKFIETLQKVED